MAQSKTCAGQGKKEPNTLLLWVLPAYPDMEKGLILCYLRIMSSPSDLVVQVSRTMAHGGSEEAPVALWGPAAVPNKNLAQHKAAPAQLLQTVPKPDYRGVSCSSNCLVYKHCLKQGQKHQSQSFGVNIF